MHEKTFYNKEGFPIGLLGVDLVFRKRVKGSKHLLKVLDAWGIDEDVFDKLGTLNCGEIRVKDFETDIVYSVLYKDFKEKMIKKSFGNPQVFLPRKYWKTTQVNVDK